MTARQQTPLERLGAWVAWTNRSQTYLAVKLGCTQSTFSRVLHGLRRPTVVLAADIEEASKTWPEGPIMAVEWGRTKRYASKRQRALSSAAAAGKTSSKASRATR
jgi:hypothetical protein